MYKKHIAIVIFAATSFCFAPQSQALVSTIEIGGWIGYGTPSFYFSIHTNVIAVPELYKISVQIPQSGAIYDMIREQKRARIEKLGGILANPQSLTMPTGYETPGLNGLTWVQYRPNGDNSISVTVPNTYGSVRWRLKYNGSFILDTTNTNARTKAVTLTKTGTSSGSTYDQEDGRNILTAEICFNSSCTNKYVSTLEVILDSWGSPPMGIVAGAIGNPGQCTPAASTLKGMNGDEVCVTLEPIFDHDSTPAFANADIEDLTPILMFTSTTARFTSHTAFPSMNSAQEALCDANWLECQLMRVAGIYATYYGHRCGNFNGDGKANAIRHAVWSAVMARLFDEYGGLSSAQAAARAEVWADAREVNMCNSPTPNTAEWMDCENNSYGRAIFTQDPSRMAWEVRNIIYAAISSGGAGTVLDQSEVCEVDL